MAPLEADLLPGERLEAITSHVEEGTPRCLVELVDFLADEDIRVEVLGPMLTKAGSVLGTSGYMSPEQGEGRPLTEASDWYSAGVMIYECLTGAAPFEGDFAQLAQLPRYVQIVPVRSNSWHFTCQYGLPG